MSRYVLPSLPRACQGSGTGSNIHQASRQGTTLAKTFKNTATQCNHSYSGDCRSSSLSLTVSHQIAPALNTGPKLSATPGQVASSIDNKYPKSIHLLGYSLWSGRVTITMSSCQSWTQSRDCIIDHRLIFGLCYIPPLHWSLCPTTGRVPKPCQIVWPKMTLHWLFMLHSFLILT